MSRRQSNTVSPSPRLRRTDPSKPWRRRNWLDRRDSENTWKRKAGLSIVEVLVTLSIVLLVTSIAFVSLKDFLPVQRLRSSAAALEQSLQRAQAEAYSKGLRVGLRIYSEDASVKIQAFYDQSEKSEFQFQPESDPILFTQAFKEGVSLSDRECPAVTATNSEQNCNLSQLSEAGCLLFFDSAGRALDSQGFLSDFQMMVTSPFLEPPFNTKEVEVLTTGLVQVVKTGKTGDALPEISAKKCALRS